MSRFNAAADRIKGSPLIIPITLVFVAMFIVSIITSYEDYTTSRLGYSQLPTRKASALVIYAVALIPQIGQIGFGYAWGREWKTNRQLAFISLFTAIGLHFVDVGTDMVYKASGQGIEVWALAFIESEILYTLGSEIMLVVSFGMLLPLIPEFVSQLHELAEMMSKAMDKLDGTEGDGLFGIGGDDDYGLGDDLEESMDWGDD